MADDFDQMPMPDALPDNVTSHRPAENNNLSEAAIASLFANRYSDTMKYDHDAGRWYEWVDTHWQSNRKGLAFDRIRIMTEHIAAGKPAMCKSSTFGGIERIASNMADMAVTSEQWDSDPWVIGTPNGVINLKKGTRISSSPDMNITKLTGCAPIKDEPDIWLKFLGDCTNNDDEMIIYLQSICGYMLTGEISEHALFFIYGSGGNGKSVFLNTLTYILGDYAVPAPMASFASAKFDAHPTDLAMLKGARLVTASETEEGRAWNESRIKQLTGGDPITARFMRKDFFTYKPQFKLCFAGNHQPTLNGVDPAMRRRFNMLPFNFKPTDPDYHLEEKLRHEAPKIFGWMIRGCVNWQKYGLGMPEVVAVATNDYFNEQDFLSQWIDDCCVCEPEQWDSVADLFASWQKYAKQAGEATSKKSFTPSLIKKGFKWSRTMKMRKFSGIALVRKEVQNYDD